MSESEPPFERTKCACTNCVECCKRHPAYLIPSDIPRIADHLKISLGELAARLRKSPGALVSKGGRPFAIGTIIPEPDATGRCSFLTADDRCSIHEVAPFGCAYFDVHMNLRESQRRSVWGLMRVASSPEYKAFREELEPTPSYRPTGYEE